MRAKSIRSPSFLIITCLIVCFFAGVSQADDTDLFRQSFGKPYVFIFFDSSSSMNLGPPTQAALPANGDDPGSTLYQAKEVAYEVFSEVYQTNGDIVHFGFASYNKDNFRVRGKHWLYQVTAGTPLSIGGIDYPNVGEQLVFGAHFPPGTESLDLSGNNPVVVLSAPAVGQLGSCAASANLSTQRIQINRFPKLSPNTDDGAGNVAGVESTTMYISSGAAVFKLVANQPSMPWLSAPSMDVHFELFDCADTSLGSTTITLTKIQEFLYHEQTDSAELGTIAQREEMTNGYWAYQATQAEATCGDDQHPFSGVGWEGNYDGYFVGDGGNPAGLNPTGEPELESFDCKDELGNPADPLTRKAECNLKQETSLHANTTADWRTQDVGDMLPFRWSATNREGFFRRLAPNWSDGVAQADLEFGVAAYFTDVPAADGYLRLRNPALTPMVPYGASPIGKALADWRCYYLGQNIGGNKCRQQEQPFGDGYDDLAAQFDSEWGCRQVYQIIIGDGENNCGGESPSADTANLRRNRIQSWVINFGGPEASDLRPLAQNTGGKYITAANRQELKNELQAIAGIILEDVRQFSAAAVPAVQADDNDKVFSSSFQPVAGASGIWPGRMDAFLKPVPLRQNGTPDTDANCNSDPTVASRANCHLWEVGEELVNQAAAIGSQFGTGDRQRRVYYRRVGPTGEGDTLRRFLAPTSPADSPSTRYDLWRGLGLISSTTLDESLLAADEVIHENNANTALTSFYTPKTTDAGTPLDTSDDFDYLLGDIFHASPLVIDQPENVKFFRDNLKDDGAACDHDNPGYRCFFLKHQNRRKMMIFGANDGLVHIADAGIRRGVDPFKDRYDDGTGREIVAFAPRATMPILYSQNSGGPRQWSVDGPPNVADVFIDPLADGSVFPEENDRQWRTVAVGGLRRGGRSYYALDITQPDTYDADGNPEPVSSGYVPSCMGIGGTLSSECGPIPYGTPLWEFSDGALVANPDRMVPFDEDANGVADLASTWSAPVMGLIQVCTGTECDPATDPNDIEDRNVAIVGGGFNSLGNAGSFLYMIDVETGTTIYKQPLCIAGTVSFGCPTAGSAPAETAVVDTNADGYVDRIYVGTLGGYILRADLVGAAGEIPVLATNQPAMDLDGTVHLVDRIIDPLYAPHEVFRAAPAGTAPVGSRQIFFRPAAGFLSDLGQTAVAFGTGDREDLFSSDQQPGKFYVFRDDIAVGDFVSRYSEDDLTPVFDDATILAGDTLTEASLSQGWYLSTKADDRLINTPFQIAGITVFTMFQPDVVVSGGNPGGGGAPPTCSRTGTSRVFAVNTRNGDGLLFNSGVRTRGIDFAGFVVTPALERAGTQNLFDPTDASSGSTDPNQTQGQVACEDDPDCRLALDQMKKLFPDSCRYSFRRFGLALNNDLLTKVGEIPIPICIIDKNWTEI